jgi:hypothetical protein
LVQLSLQDVLRVIPSLANQGYSGFIIYEENIRNRDHVRRLQDLLERDPYNYYSCVHWEGHFEVCWDTERPDNMIILDRLGNI